MSLKTYRTSRLVIAGAALLSLFFGTGQAVAAGPSDGKAPTVAEVFKASGATVGEQAAKPASAAGLDGCPYPFDSNGPAPAYYACHSVIWTYTWPNGHKEYSLLGTDGAVWDSWQLSDGTYSAWTSMGGHDLVFGVEWFYANGSSGTDLVTMGALGSDGNAWCRTYVGGWGNWYNCTNTTYSGDAGHPVN